MKKIFNKNEKNSNPFGVKQIGILSEKEISEPFHTTTWSKYKL